MQLGPWQRIPGVHTHRSWWCSALGPFTRTHLVLWLNVAAAPLPAQAGSMSACADAAPCAAPCAARGTFDDAASPKEKTQINSAHTHHPHITHTSPTQQQWKRSSSTTAHTHHCRGLWLEPHHHQHQLDGWSVTALALPRCTLRRRACRCAAVLLARWRPTAYPALGPRRRRACPSRPGQDHQGPAGTPWWSFPRRTRQ